MSILRGIARRLAPTSIRRLIANRRLIRSVPGLSKQVFYNLLALLNKRVDLAALARLESQYASLYCHDPQSAAKYADWAHWASINVTRGASLHLHESTRKRILDIGCGPGHFLALCTALGHEAIGLDAAASDLSELENDLYRQMLTALHCLQLRTSHTIKAFQPLPLIGTFDLITSFLVCFNNHKTSKEWGADEWMYFVRDAISHLVPGGMLLLELNENSSLYGESRYWDERTRTFFVEQGLVANGTVTIVRAC